MVDGDALAFGLRLDAARDPRGGDLSHSLVREGLCFLQREPWANRAAFLIERRMAEVSVDKTKGALTRSVLCAWSTAAPVDVRKSRVGHGIPGSC